MKRTILTLTLLALALGTIASNRSATTQAHNLRLRTDALTAVAPQEEGSVTEEFHQTYPLSATGRVSIENINGPVHITAWDATGVKVDAIKRGKSKEDLDQVTIDVTTTADRVRVRTKYPEWNESSKSKEGHWNNSASVEYTLTIPRTARLSSADLVNGSLDIEGVQGSVEANCVNGRVTAHSLGGEVKLSTVNGAVDCSVSQLDEAKSISLNSVNGSIVLTIPANASALVKANTIHGPITNDFGLKVSDGDFVGHDLSGQIGTGGPHIRLSNVNGPMSIKRG